MQNYSLPTMRDLTDDDRGNNASVANVASLGMTQIGTVAVYLRQYLDGTFSANVIGDYGFARRFTGLTAEAVFNQAVKAIK